MKFLLVDDSAVTRRAIGHLLRQFYAAEVVEAPDGLDALARCDGSFDAVVTDWNMPHCPGIEFVRRLRKLPAMADVPVLLVTSRNTK